MALIATESVSIALSWLLLPPEVGVNRHGHIANTDCADTGLELSYHGQT